MSEERPLTSKEIIESAPREGRAIGERTRFGGSSAFGPHKPPRTAAQPPAPAEGLSTEREARIRSQQNGEWYDPQLEGKTGDARDVAYESIICQTQANVQHCLDELDRLRDRIRELEAERDAAKANADFLRCSVGECHLMISRNTSEFQIHHTWKPTDLPPRLKKLFEERNEAQHQLADAQGKLVAVQTEVERIRDRYLEPFVTAKPSLGAEWDADMRELAAALKGEG